MKITTKSEKILVRCKQCGTLFKPPPDGCPECRLRDIFMENDWPSPDQMSANLTNKGMF